MILRRSPKSGNIFVIDGAHRLSAFIAWVHDDYGDKKISIHGNSFSGIARLRLLNILQARCEELGIPIKFHREISEVVSLRHECDLLVGADGVNSRLRQAFADNFKPELSVRPNKYIWYGSHQLFHGLTLTFRETPAGTFAAHSYKFNQTTSTFIIECDQETWSHGGFAVMSDGDTREYLEQVFARAQPLVRDADHQPQEPRRPQGAPWRRRGGRDRRADAAANADGASQIPAQLLRPTEAARRGRFEPK